VENACSRGALLALEPLHAARRPGNFAGVDREDGRSRCALGVACRDGRTRDRNTGTLIVRGWSTCRTAACSHPAPDVGSLECSADSTFGIRYPPKVFWYRCSGTELSILV
jgi:hypothetical protein